MDGRVFQEKSNQSTWEELRDHAAFPSDRATRDVASCMVAAGTFDCWRYTVRGEKDGAATTSVFHFANDRPGPPVLYEMYVEGERSFRMELREDSRR